MSPEKRLLGCGVAAGVLVVVATALFVTIFFSRTNRASRALDSEFATSLPRDMKVVNYYGESVGMDLSFAWVLTPGDGSAVDQKTIDEFIKQLVANANLVRAAPGVSPVGMGYSFPDWWNHEYIHSQQECYYNNQNGERRVWVDRERGVIFIESIGA